MIVFLRYLSFLNASIWAGASVFLLISLPALFGPDMTRLLTEAYVGFPAEAILKRYYLLQYICSGVAFIHLVAEWLYLGRRVQRFTLWLLLGIAGLGLLGGLVLQPKVQSLHIAKYWNKVPAVRVEAAKSLKVWHGVSEVLNLIMVGGIVIHLFRVTRNPEGSRFLGH